MNTFRVIVVEDGNAALPALNEPDRCPGVALSNLGLRDKGSDEIEAATTLLTRWILRKFPAPVVCDLDQEILRTCLASNGDRACCGGVLNRVGNGFMGGKHHRSPRGLTHPSQLKPSIE